MLHSMAESSSYFYLEISSGMCWAVPICLECSKGSIVRETAAPSHDFHGSDSPHMTPDVLPAAPLFQAGHFHNTFI